jgi:hypothetical protein
MGSGLAPKNFPWPSTIGSSPAAAPLTQSMAPGQVGATSPYGGTNQPGSSGTPAAPTLPATPTPPTQPPQNPLLPKNPLAPITRPVAGGSQLGLANAFYGA